MTGWLPYAGPLGTAEAGELARRAREGDAGARWAFVAGLTPLILRDGRRFAARIGRARLGRELVDAAAAHLWACAHQYDPARGAPSTWAGKVIRTAFRDEAAAIGYACRAPRAVPECRPGDPADPAVRAARGVLRLDAARLDFGVERLDPHPGRGPTPAEAAEHADDLEALRRAEASVLDDRERRVLALRYRDGMKKVEAARALGVSQERVRQVEAGALRKLRAALEGATP